MKVKSAAVIKKKELLDFDETLYVARRLRGGLNILKNMDEKMICEFGYCELLQLTWLFLDQLEKYIKDLDLIIEDLISAGARDYETKA